MPNENFGASFEIDVTQLKAGLAQANRLIRESESEFKAAAAGMDDWTKSQAGLEAKMKSLNSAQDLQKKKIAALQKEYNRLIDEGIDPASAEMVKLRTDINKEQEALNKTERAQREYTEALENLANEAEDAADSVEDVGEAARDSGEGFTVMKGAVANLISDGLGALISSAKDAVAGLLNLADETKNTRTQMAKLQASFAQSGHDAEVAAEIYKDFYAVLGDEDKATEAAAHVAQLSDDVRVLNKWTDIATGVFATFGDSLPIEALTEAANETQKTGKLTGALADALNWAGVNEDKFQEKLDKMTTEQERNAYITDTLLGLYDETGKAYRDINDEIIQANYAQADFTETQAALGEKMQPVMTTIREGIGEVLAKFNELMDGVDFDAISAGIREAFDWFIGTGVPAIKDGLGWIIDNKDELIAGIAGIGAAFAAFKVVTLIQAVTGALKGMTIAQAALNLVMSLNPIGLLVAAIAGLIAAVVLLWKNSESFKTAVLGIFDRIKQGFNAVVQFFKNGLQTIKRTFSGIGSWFAAKFTEAMNGIKNAFAGIGSFFGGIWNTIVSTFSTVGTKVANAIGGAFKSAINAVIGTVEGALNAIPNSVNRMIGKINELPGVNIGNIPTVSLPRLARGGVVDQATAAIIGEAGKEAVVPLENNLEWLDKLADKLSEKMGTGGGVTVNQTNHYSREHSRRELWQSKQDITHAVKIATRRAKA